MMKFRRVLLSVFAIALTLMFSFTSFAAVETGKDLKQPEPNKQVESEKITKVEEGYNAFAYGNDSSEAVTEEFPTINECFAWIKGKGLNGTVYSKTNAKKPVAIYLGGCEINLDKNYILRYDSKKVLYNQKTLVVQQTLNLLGYKLKEDGLFGKHTSDEIKLFQKSVGLEADGIIGEKTLEKLASYNYDPKNIAKK